MYIKNDSNYNDLATYLSSINRAKINIKNALANKGISLDGVPFSGYANKIRTATGNNNGGGETSIPKEPEKTKNYIQIGNTLSGTINENSPTLNDKSRPCVDYILDWNDSQNKTVFIKLSANFYTYLSIVDSNNTVLYSNSSYNGGYGSRIVLDLSNHQKPLIIKASSSSEYGDFTISCDFLFDANTLPVTDLNITGDFPIGNITDVIFDSSVFSLMGDGYYYALIKISRISIDSPTQQNNSFDLRFKPQETQNIYDSFCSFECVNIGETRKSVGTEQYFSANNESGVFTTSIYFNDYLSHYYMAIRINASTYEKGSINVCGKYYVNDQNVSQPIHNNLISINDNVTVNMTPENSIVHGEFPTIEHSLVWTNDTQGSVMITLYSELNAVLYIKDSTGHILSSINKTDVTNVQIEINIVDYTSPLIVGVSTPDYGTYTLVTTNVGSQN